MEPGIYIGFSPALHLQFMHKQQQFKPHLTGKVSANCLLTHLCNTAMSLTSMKASCRQSIFIVWDDEQSTNYPLPPPRPPRHYTFLSFYIRISAACRTMVHYMHDTAWRSTCSKDDVQDKGGGGGHYAVYWSCILLYRKYPHG